MSGTGQPETDEPKDWNELFRRQIPDLLRLAVRLTGNLQDAEDIVQESLLRAVRYHGTFRGDSSLRTWISRIVVNVFRTWSKKPALKTTDEATGECAADPAVRVLERAEQAAVVADHVSRLPERQREVLVLSFYEDMTAAEVAEVLEITTQNVYATLSLARQQLRISLSFLNEGSTQS